VIFEKRKEYSKLRYKWRELSKEYTDLRGIEKMAWADFYETSMRYIEEHGLKSPFSPKEEEEKSANKKIFQEDETKAVYREAAIKTHPDKHGGEYVDIFKGISRAKSEGSLNRMLEEARKVNVKPEEISIEQICVLEDELNELEKKIDEIRFSVHWTWYHANNSQKQIILEKILNIQHA
jgi:hypothetical protein